MGEMILHCLLALFWVAVGILIERYQLK